MIEIKAKKDCSGCHACANICPQRCIEMKSDEEGFLYPIVNKDVCINCGLCENVCPVINQNEPRKPLKVYAAKNKNEEVRMQSSSGGVFTLMAENVIKEGGVVFGAKFNDNWDVVHAWTDNIEGIAVFRGSKYVQSTIGNTYQEAKQFLEQGRKVLFSGTPCQIAGLNKYLRKEYDNLLTVDIVCHGVPSPLVWHTYLNEISKTNFKCSSEKKSILLSKDDSFVIRSISFRDKTNGWKRYGFRICYDFLKSSKDSKSNFYKEKVFFQRSEKNIYMKGFLNNLYLRPSCYHCFARSGKSNSDISIGDFWGVHKYYPNFDDNKGISMILINSKKGKSAYDMIEVLNIESTYNQAMNGNPCLEYSVEQTDDRRIFWEKFSILGLESIYQLCKKNTPSFLRRVVNKLRRMFKI